VNPRPESERGADGHRSRRTVALVTPAWPPGLVPNGIVTYGAHIVSALRSRGLDVFVVAGEDTSPQRDPRVSVPAARPRALPWRVLRRVRDVVDPGGLEARRTAFDIAREVRRLHDEHGVELVEMEESFGLCGWVADQCPVPVVARLHGPWFLNGPLLSQERSRGFRTRVAREGRALERVAGISVPSRAVLERTRQHYGKAFQDAEVIPNPVPPVADERRWRAGACEPDTILFVGRFDRIKGADVLIEAFARIRATRARARLVFAGPDGGVTDAQGRRWSLLTFLEDRLPREADRTAVQWLGAMPADAIPDLRRRAAVTIVCSRWENFPYSLGEAMAHGCPIVATSTGGIAEMITNAQDGLLVPPGDSAALARATLELLEAPARAAALGGRAAETSMRLLAPETIGRETDAFYGRVLAKVGSR
jgi:glycosyltransferase involved in cell wall biosynthesis